MERQITFDELIRKISTASLAMERGEIAGLTEAAILVRDAAKAKFGKYQPGWALLNPDYLREKLAAGSPGPEPLIGYYRGKGNQLWPVHLRDSLEFTVVAQTKTAHIGTNDPLGKWHEEGRIRRNSVLPPRPFLRPALFENEREVGRIIRDAVAQALREHFSR
jgi:phage gpG-like protein